MENSYRMKMECLFLQVRVSIPPPFVVSVGLGQWVVVWSNNQQDNGDIFLKWFWHTF